MLRAPTEKSSEEEGKRSPSSDNSICREQEAGSVRFWNSVRILLEWELGIETATSTAWTFGVRCNRYANSFRRRLNLPWLRLMLIIYQRTHHHLVRITKYTEDSENADWYSCGSHECSVDMLVLDAYSRRNNFAISQVHPVNDYSWFKIGSILRLSSNGILVTSIEDGNQKFKKDPRL